MEYKIMPLAGNKYVTFEHKIGGTRTTLTIWEGEKMVVRVAVAVDDVLALARALKG